MLSIYANLYGGPRDGEIIPHTTNMSNKPPTRIELASAQRPDDTAPPSYRRTHYIGVRNSNGHHADVNGTGLPAYSYVYEPIWARANPESTEEGTTE